MFSWFDSYDIYDEEGQVAYTVKGKLWWGHKLNIYDKNGNLAGVVQEEILRFLPRFTLIQDGKEIGYIKKEFTFLKPVFSLSCRDWTVKGDCLEWNYEVRDGQNELIMTAGKRVLSWTDTYVIEYGKRENELLSLMIVLAIDAAKCSQGN